MFGSGYWYVGPAPDGRRFCYAKAPSYICPVHEAAQEARRPEAEAPPQLAAAAEALGVEVRWLAASVGRYGHERARVDGKLTERCRCGARMRRLGFACWEEAPPTEEGSLDRMAERLGFSHMERGQTRYQDTKREAEAWARRQLQHAKQ